MNRSQIVGLRLTGVLLSVVLVAGSADGTPALADNWKATLQQTASVAVTKVAKAKVKVPTTASYVPADVTWPAATQATVVLTDTAAGRMARAGTSPMKVGVPDGAKPQKAATATVQVLDRASSDTLVGLGVVAAVTASAGAPVQVSMDYSGFASAGGAGFGSRLQLVTLPGCALTTPQRVECQVQTPLETVNDPAARVLTATLPGTGAGPQVSPSATPTGSPSVAPSITSTPSTSASPPKVLPTSSAQPSVSSTFTPGGAAKSVTVLAAAAATTSEQGDYTATSLKPSAAWAAGSMSGEFTWSYPIAAPDVPGEVSPELSIGYSSGGTDGGVSNTNNQASWVGEGFELGSAFIERKYAGCYDDRSGGTNSSSTASDLCWYTDSKKTNNQKWDNAFLSMAGHAGELVRIGNTAEWRLEVDDGTRVAKIGTAASNNEYWRVTTPDGTQYFFGKGKADGAATATNATWSVPVSGNHSAEPGYNSSFASSFVLRPWRWNLDYVVSPTGVTMTYFYVKETNKYKKNLATSTSYDRGGYLSKIQYGERKGAETVDDSPAKVTFTVEERCDTTISSACKTTKPTSSTAKAWPDVPMDAVCDADYCPSQKTAPTFFSRKRLKQVDTHTRNAAGTAWEAVDSWVLAGSFPKPSDGGAVPSLWLSSITRTGKAASSSIALPAVNLSPIMLDSRISGSGVALEKPRLAVVTSETGAQTIVEYSHPECTSTTLPSSGDIPTNTKRCMPVYYSGGTAAPSLQWFNKYVVLSVTERDPVGQADSSTVPVGLDIGFDEVTSYTYTGGGAWRYNDSPLIKAKYRTWGEWRGFGKITTIAGKGTTKEVDETLYFRGMNGDRATSTGGTKTVTVSDSTGGTWPDDDWLAGTIRETRALTAVGGSEDTGSLMDPAVRATMSGAAPAADGRLTSHQIDVGKTITRQKTPTGTRTGSDTVLAWDQFGQPTLAEDQGDLAVTGDETCTRTSYATPTTASTGPIGLVAEESVSAGTCNGGVDYATALSATRHHYGTTNYTDTVSLPGLETKTVQLRDGNPRLWVTTGTASYDTWGRPLTATDPLSNTTSTSYSHTTGGLLSATTTTSPDPDGAGALTPHTTTVSYDTRLGAPIKTVQPGGQTSEAALDALGRVTSVWQPGQPKTSPASATYSYTISKTTTSSVTSKTLLPTGTTYTTTIALLDSILRPRQTQTQSAAGGRIITDTRYDSRGATVLSDTYYNADVPATTLVMPTFRDNITTSHRYSVDFAGRTTIDALYGNETLRWQTVTGYLGDRTTVTPPAGGTPTTTMVDINGQTTQLIQHLGTDTTAPGATTSYHYDLLGQLTAMTDDKANTWTYGYDLAGNKIFSHDPDKGTTTSTYDAAGQLTSTTDARNVTLKYFYDNLGRPTTTTKADGTTTLISTSYDTVQKGQVTASSRHLAGGTLTSRVNSYDSAGRATSTSMIVPEIAGLIGAQLAGTYTSTTSFNADGSIQNQTLPAAGPIPTETLTTGYTSLTGQPDTLTGTLGSTTATYVQDTQYLAWGTPVAMLFGTHSGRLSQVTFQRDDTTQRLTGTALYRSGQGGVSDESDTLSYDPAGNITQVKAALADGSVDNQCFSYDYQQQLTEAWTPTGTSCDPNGRSQANLAGPAPYWTSWTTDTIGKTSQRIDRTVTKSSTTSYSYTANGENASRPHFVTGTATTGSSPGTASYTADAAGNTATRPNPGGGTQTLTWDELNQLTEVTKDGTSVAQMVYDASGIRVLRKQGDTTTLFLGGDEITLNTATSAVTANRYYTHGGQTVAVRTGVSNDTVTTLISDWQGTTHHQINNATGAITTSWQDPYGAPRGTPPTTWTGERGYVGGTKDATGLTRIGARDYDPALQRFSTVDPVQDLADPLQWNPYIYSNNSPITKADPTGLVPAGPSLIDGIYRVVATKDKKGKIHRKVVPTAGELQRRAWLRRVKAAATVVAAKRVGTAAGNSSWRPKPKEFTWGPSGTSTYGRYESAATGNWTPPGTPVPTGYGVLAQDTAAELLGINDAKRCSVGDAVSCTWLAIGIVPIGKIGKIGKLVGSADRIGAAARSADVLSTPVVESTKLQNLVKNLYKGTTNPNRIGNGTTMDAIRNEIATGASTNGRMHITKGQESLRGLDNWLAKNPDGTYHDRLVAQSLADELRGVLPK